MRQFDLRQLTLDALKNSPAVKKLAKEIDEEVMEELLPYLRISRPSKKNL